MAGLVVVPLGRLAIVVGTEGGGEPARADDRPRSEAGGDQHPAAGRRRHRGGRAAGHGGRPRAGAGRRTRSPASGGSGCCCRFSCRTTSWASAGPRRTGRAASPTSWLDRPWPEVNSAVGVWAALTVGAVPLTYLVVAVGLATRAEPSLVRAARASGAGPAAVLWTITLPAVASRHRRRHRALPRAQPAGLRHPAGAGHPGRLPHGDHRDLPQPLPGQRCVRRSSSRWRWPCCWC